MTKTEARDLAKEMVENILEDIITTCEGVPEDIKTLKSAICIQLARAKV